MLARRASVSRLHASTSASSPAATLARSSSTDEAFSTWAATHSSVSGGTALRCWLSTLTVAW